jgi:hypothetical protein
MFGPTPAEELATDAEGFRVLSKGFMIAAIVLAIVGAEALLARRAYRGQPALADGPRGAAAGEGRSAGSPAAGSSSTPGANPTDRAPR